MMATPGVTSQAAAPTSGGQQIPDLDTQQSAGDLASNAQSQQDFSDQWIEYYIANGRPDYAEQIIQMKKQQTQKQ